MIKNEKQYRITKAQVRRFQDAVAEVAGQARPLEHQRTIMGGPTRGGSEPDGGIRRAG